MDDDVNTAHVVRSGNKVGVSSKQKRDGIVYTYILSCCAATVAESVTYPLDLTKTRLQIQGEGIHRSVRHGGPSSPYRGMIRTALGIAQEEGLLKLWQGATPAIYRHLGSAPSPTKGRSSYLYLLLIPARKPRHHVPDPGLFLLPDQLCGTHYDNGKSAVYTGCRIGLYEWMRENVLGRNSDGTYTFWKAILSGLTAGAVAQFIASPTDLVKIHMQMEGKLRLEGHPPRVKNTWHAFSRIFQEGGVRGLWKGWMPNVQRAALVNLGELTTYDTVKHQILKYTKLEDKPLTHALSSLCSGLVAATVGTPADVVKTRYMNQTITNGKGMLYKSSMDCLVKTVSHEGMFALYKGFLPTWARMAPWSFTFWLTYEQIRRLTGVSSF